MTTTVIYNRVAYFVKEYGSSGIPDQRAVQEFMECETAEMIRSLQNELIGLSKGNYDREVMDKVIGVKRRTLFGSYEEWAKLMLMWISGYKA
jgi:hypothetical protein